MTRRALAVLLALNVPAAGCLSIFKDEAPVEAEDVEGDRARKLLGDEGRATLEEAASATPKNFTFPAQLDLPQKVVWFNGSVGPETDASFEGNQDQGGIEYGYVIQKQDVTPHVPPGQPVEIFIKVRWDAKELNGVDFDIYVDVPGTKTSYYPAKSEDVNWNIPTKVLTVNTIGVPGRPHDIGVQAASGKTISDVQYEMRIEFNYAKDVLTPAVPWAFQVPANATGLILESVKVAGDEHIRSEFIVVGPKDDLVSFVEFNDLAIPTESVFIPVPAPGEYVFWAYYLHGGFLSIKADAPLDAFAARALGIVETSTALDSAPVPGMIERDWSYGSVLAERGVPVPTPMQGQKQATFALEGAHPIGVYAYLNGPGTLASQVRISSPTGIVHDLYKILRYEDERGSIGYSSEEGYDNQVYYANVTKGGYTVDYVNNGPTEVGYTVVSYAR